MQNKDARIWNRLANGYAKSQIKDQASFQHKLDKTQSYMRPDMRVLEFGCGTGGTAIYHAPKVAHITGIDFSSQMIGHAREKLGASNATNVDFHVASIEEWQADGGSYDMILGLSVLHLLQDQTGTLARAHDLLATGGLLVTSTVCTDVIPMPVRWALPLARMVGLAPYVNAPTRAGLTEMIVNAGFDIDYDWQPRKGAAVFIVARKRA